MAESFSREVLTASAGERLDIFVGRMAGGISRSAAARRIRDGAVRVNARIAKPGLRLRAGDRVDYVAESAMVLSAQPENIPLEIVFEDEDLVVVNKPAGMVTHPAPGHARGTLVNALLHHVPFLSGINGGGRPGIVHRLDKDTTGLLLAAKHDQSHRMLAAALQDRSLHRRYAAVVWGGTEENSGVVETYLGRDPKNRKRFAVVPQPGKLARTRFQVMERFPGFCLLQLDLDTGRTHQIRVHCLASGMPVVGDREYGKRGEARDLIRMRLMRPSRQLLHAARLEFVHPVSGSPLAFEAPLPADFSDFMEALRKQPG